MDLNKFKLGVGPMSSDIVELCLEYSKTYEFPIMIIASRNQVDAYSGYAFTTPGLISFVKNSDNYDPSRVLICRDHCGPYFSDADKDLNLRKALDKCLETVKADVSSGFDLLHIDVSRVEDAEQEKIARTLLDYALDLKPSIIFEFGSEDNTGEGLARSLSRLRRQLKFVEQYKTSIKFFVSQTGSLTKHKQVGKFNVETNTKVAETIHSAGLLFKEHNADYITADQVKLRQQAGVDAINIAPQLGAIQSSVLTQLGDKVGATYTEFVSYVLEQGFWKKWVTEDVTDDKTKFIASAHYCFNSQLGKKLLAEIRSKSLPFDDMLREQLFKELDEYRLGYQND
jgi:D-tagatose-1,6-bisphosphate aldolase subunit GatZ/KbaZ